MAAADAAMDAATTGAVTAAKSYYLEPEAERMLRFTLFQRIFAFL